MKTLILSLLTMFGTKNLCDQPFFSTNKIQSPLKSGPQSTTDSNRTHYTFYRSPKSEHPNKFI